MSDTSAETTTNTRPTAVGSRWLARWLFWAPVVPLVALDLWSKWYVLAWLAGEQPSRMPNRREVAFDFLPDPLGFSLVHWENNGTIWGLFQEYTWPLMVLRTFAVGILAWIAWRTPVLRRLQLGALGLILAGALGNLYDNVFMANRAVRDFLLFYWEHGDGTRSVFPAFNVADSCITVGALGLAILLWRDPGDRSAADATWVRPEA